ncbi:hypothetical protein C1H76_3945 [Elsinoe australis]|uniref:Uncharacterized protein n=1 Tax=Elsinoe australis TaxID=40998 RepID=A0A4U7B8S1_9PEZI|nr:hypothetical protein C1H76_3945 [Elsinoe australis]
MTASKGMTVTTRSSARKRTPSQVFAAEPHDIRYEDETTRYDNDTFSILPIELRDRIYHECLVSPKPIDVSKISPISEWKDNRVQCHFEPDPKATAASLSGLSVNLLRASPKIAAEASRIFYGKNVFAFHGHKSWSPVVSWLRSIGLQNRAYLTALELDVHELLHVYQYADGHRESWDPQHEVLPRHPLLHKRQDEDAWPAGEVDEVDGEMEDVFAALADVEDGANLTMRLRYIGPGFLGAFEEPENLEQGNEELYVSMDLPNLVEAWRKEWSAQRNRQIDVTWHMWGAQYRSGKTTIDYIRDQLEVNWDILDIEEIEEEIESLEEPEKMIHQYAEKIDIRRKPTGGKIIHSEPNLYSFKVPPHEAREAGGICGFQEL